MKKQKTVIGSGVYNLDSIYEREYPEGFSKQRKFVEHLRSVHVGGTCGNVMCMLSYYGWNAFPEASFDDSEEGFKMTSDLKEYGCDCRLVSNTPKGGTTLLRCTHKRDAEGNHVASFRATSPGSMFAKRHFLRAKDEVPVFLESLDFVPSVYFFDRPAAGNRALAAALRAKGSLVYFEPDKVSENADLDAVRKSDIIKFSGENIPDISFAEQFSDKLFIQTLGSEGLRFKLRSGEWINLPACPVETVVDWEGAGDWTTSTFLNELAENESLEFSLLTEGIVKNALVKAQAFAAKSVGYLSSKGIIDQGR